MNLRCGLSFLVAGGVVAAFAKTADVPLVLGGNPECLSKATTVRLESEKIKLKIGKRWTTVTCAFVLKNEGPSCSVKIGIPAQTFGPAHNAGEDAANSASTDAELQSFQAFVDGKKSSAQPVGSGQSELQLKTIRFGRHQTHFVLNEYKVRTGIASTADKTLISEAGFSMHGKMPWNGSIEKVTVLAEFEAVVAPSKLHAVSARKLKVSFPTEYTNWSKVKRGAVYYHGFAVPQVQGRNFLFVAHNLIPAKRSDLYLYWRTSSGEKVFAKKRLPRKQPATRKSAGPSNKIQPEESER